MYDRKQARNWLILLVAVVIAGIVSHEEIYAPGTIPALTASLSQATSALTGGSAQAGQIAISPRPR